jgi:chromosome partitioning protein
MPRLNERDGHPVPRETAPMILARASCVANDGGPVSEPEHLQDRAASIFERLRAGVDSESESLTKSPYDSGSESVASSSPESELAEDATVEEGEAAELAEDSADEEAAGLVEDVTVEEGEAAGLVEDATVEEGEAAGLVEDVTDEPAGLTGSEAGEIDRPGEVEGDEPEPEPAPEPPPPWLPSPVSEVPVGEFPPAWVPSPVSEVPVDQFPPAWVPSPVSEIPVGEFPLVPQDGVSAPSVAEAGEVSVLPVATGHATSPSPAEPTAGDEIGGHAVGRVGDGAVGQVGDDAVAKVGDDAVGQARVQAGGESPGIEGTGGYGASRAAGLAGRKDTEEELGGREDIDQEPAGREDIDEGYESAPIALAPVEPPPPATQTNLPPGGSQLADRAVADVSSGRFVAAEISPLPEPDGTRQRIRHPAAIRHALPRRLAVANQKGGVGKTTTAVNLGAALAEMDYRVLVVDLDPQGNATTGLGINGRNLDASVYDVILHDVPVEDVIEPTTIRNLFGVPATIDLAGAEIELVPAFSRELRLKRALEPIEADFDFIFIDCPPSLGLITVNGLAAANEVVVPIQCEYYALEGLGQLLRNVGLVQTNLNSGLEVSTIILTMYDARTRLAAQVVEEVRRHFGDKVCNNVVPRSVRLSEAPSFGQPITVFDPSSRGAIAYRELAKEVSGGAPQRVR